MLTGNDISQLGFVLPIKADYTRCNLAKRTDLTQQSYRCFGSKPRIYVLPLETDFAVLLALILSVIKTHENSS